MYFFSGFQNNSVIVITVLTYDMTTPVILRRPIAEFKRKDLF